MNNLKEKWKSLGPKKQRMAIISAAVVILLLILIIILAVVLSGGEDAPVYEGSGGSGRKKNKDTTVSSETESGEPSATEPGKEEETTAVPGSMVTGESRYDNIIFRPFVYDGTPTGSFTSIVMPDNGSYLGENSSRGENDLNTYEITLSYDDQGAEHMAAELIDENSRLTGCYAGLWFNKNDGLYDDRLKAVMTEDGADLPYMTIAPLNNIDYDEMITMHFGIVHADYGAEFPEDVVVYLRSLLPKLYWTGYSSREDMYIEYCKTKALEYLDYYAERKGEESWDGEFFSDEYFDVGVDGLRQRFWMSLENTRGEREYIDFDGDPGYVDTHIIQTARYEGEVDFCDIAKTIWLGGDRGSCLELKFERIPLRYKDCFMRIMASIHPMGFKKFESVEDKASSGVRFPVYNDYVVRVEYDGSVIRGSSGNSEVAAAFINDRMETGKNHVQLDFRNIYDETVYVVAGRESADDGLVRTARWVEEQSFYGHVKYRNGMTVYEKLGIDSWGYYAGYYVIIPLPGDDEMRDSRGNVIDYIYVKLMVPANRNTDGTSKLKMFQVEDMLDDLLSHLSISIEGRLGNGEWRNVSYTVSGGDGKTYMFER
ncbi:MAG: hypothetical protein IKN24_08955 [Lachnospiraceae bacterium]|nr:hypothetical protein [Lachnospiraceae bacterium]